MARKTCPGCDEPVQKGRPKGGNGGWSLGVEPGRLQHRHRDGEPLCPEMTSKGYQPAKPKR